MSKNTLHTGIAVTVTLVVVAVFFIFGVPFSGNSASTQVASSQVVTQDEVVGTGPAAMPGDTLSVHYTGKLQDGTVFDSSAGRLPYTLVLGAGNVIPGWEQGLVGMQAGGKRLLIIPPSLGYGANDYGPIPGNSTLVFEVEVVSITPAQ
jgi:FKBP-type peptidyl-prolyl cis-trans isomerase